MDEESHATRKIYGTRPDTPRSGQRPTGQVMSPSVTSGEGVFQALQTYGNGEVVRWIDTAPPGAAEPEHPAPVLTLTPADPSPAASATTSGDPDSSNTAGVVLGIIGIVLGIIGIGLGLLNRRPGRRTGAD